MVLFVSCGLGTPQKGEPVTQRVSKATFEARANGTDLVRITTYFPSTSSGQPVPGLKPGVVFIQGGFVQTEQYAWQAVALAEAGFVVAVPENALALAFFSVGAGEAARALLASPPPASVLDGLVDPARIAVAGHSLGSVVALKLALQGEFAAVVLEAGFPDAADLSKLPSFSKPSLSLAGELDCSAKLDGVRDGWNSLPAPTALVVLPGVTHFQFTNSDAEDVKRKCPPTRPLDEAHADISAAVLGFLGAALGEGTVGEAALRGIPNATVEVRP